MHKTGFTQAILAVLLAVALPVEFFAGAYQGMLAGMAGDGGKPQGSNHADQQAQGNHQPAAFLQIRILRSHDQQGSGSLQQQSTDQELDKGRKTEWSHRNVSWVLIVIFCHNAGPTNA